MPKFSFLYLIPKFWAAIFAIALLNGNAQAKEDPILELMRQQALEQSGPGLIQSVGEFIQIRLGMMLKPEIIRDRLRRCGNCKERAALEQELQDAELTLQLTQLIEAAVLKMAGMPPNKWARMAGINIRPDSVEGLPRPSIYLWDRMVKCSDQTDETLPLSFGGSCYHEFKLFDLSTKKDLKEFSQFVDFLQQKARGEVVSENKTQPVIGQTILYYNLKSADAIPLPKQGDLSNFTVWKAYSKAERHQKADLVGKLLRVSVKRVHPANIDSYLPGTFLPAHFTHFSSPWREVLQKDYAQTWNSHFLECGYAINADTIKSYLFWKDQIPPQMDRKALAERMPAHILLLLGNPIANCPTTETAARSQFTGTEYAVLYETYKQNNMLKSNR